MQSALTNKQTIVDEFKNHGYKCKNHDLGIWVHMNSTQHIDISRLPNNEITLDIHWMY